MPGGMRPFLRYTMSQVQICACAIAAIVTLACKQGT